MKSTRSSRLSLACTQPFDARLRRLTRLAAPLLAVGALSLACADDDDEDDTTAAATDADAGFDDGAGNTDDDSSGNDAATPRPSSPSQPDPSDEGDEGDASDTPSDDEIDSGSSVGPAVAGEFCAAAADRIDPSNVTLTDDTFDQLGLGRSGTNALRTAQTNQRLRYVSAASGSDDGDGSRDDPWRSLQHAADSVSAGTTVLVDATGPYEPFEIAEGGADGAYVIFENENPGELPLIAGNPKQTALVRISASYVVFQGFELANHPGSSLDNDTIGIEIEPEGDDLSFIEVRGNVIHDIGPNGLDDAECYYNGHGIIAHSEGDLISNLTISGNEMYNLYVGNSEVLVVNGNIEDFCVSSNFIHDVNNIAIDIIGYEQNDSETARQGQIVDNVVLDASNYWPYCSRGNCTYPPGDESSDGIYVDGGADLEIAYNIVGRADHGIELQSENGELIRNVEVHDNLIFNSNYKNLTVGQVEDSREYDNVLVDEPDLADAELESCK